MASTAALEILLRANDQASPVLDKTAGKMAKFGGAAKVAIGALSGAAAAGALGFLSDAAQAAADDEANILKLQRAVENSGVSWEANSAAIEERIKKGQDLAFSDDATRNALASLTESTGSVDEAMKRLGPAMDLARAKTIPLEAAAKLLGKVSDENTTALKKYGIVMKDGATATDVLAKVQEIAGGQAETYGASTKGMIDKTKDAFGEWKESVGAALGPAQGVVALLPGLSSGMLGAGTAIGSAVPLVKGLNVAMKGLLGPVGLIVLAVGLLALAWSSNFMDIQGKTKAAFDFIGGIFDGLKVLLANVGLALIGIVRGAINGVVGFLNGLIDAWNAVADALHLPILGKIAVSTPGLDAAEAALNEAARPRFTTISVATIMTGGGGEHSVIANATGGDYMVNRPTLFLAGEAGVERATFTPLRGGGNGGGGAGGMTVNVHVHGSVIGLTDLEARVRQAVVDGVRGGGFRGVFR